MGMALGEEHSAAGAQPKRRLAIQLDVALALGDQMEDHHPLGAGLEQGGGEIRPWRVVAPGRGEPGVDEDRAAELHHAQRF